MGNPRVGGMLRAAVTNMSTDKTVIFAFAGETEEELLALKDLIEDGKISSTVDRVYPMERVAEAHRRVDTEQRLGSVVISLGPTHADAPTPVAQVVRVQPIDRARPPVDGPQR